MGILDRIAISALPLMPRPMMRMLASRYIAGETLESALERLEDLGSRGFTGMLDLLGEDVEDEAAAREVVRTYGAAAARMAAQRIDAYVSVKPTHVGLRISEELCFELYRELVDLCAESKTFVRVEMEDHTTTDATLRVFERLRKHSERVGIVLQSRLFRTLEDIDRLAEGPLSVRMVKGIYLEPEEIAHVKPEPIRRAYLDCVRKLVDRGAYVSLATHDDGMAATVLELLREKGVDREGYELQVLLGVRERLWDQWKSEGHPVRVYVPYGPQWHPYSMRRLQKNPEIFRHLVRDFFSLRR